MVKGNIFIDKEGINIRNIQVANRNSVLSDFIFMRENALKNEDSFFYVRAQEWDEFYENVWNKNNPYWEGVDQLYIGMFQNDSFFYQRRIDDLTEFNSMPEPRIHGGFGYNGHPVVEYTYNFETWKDWHDKWYLDYPEVIDWDNSNGVFPFYIETIKILTNELKKLKKSVEESENDFGLAHNDRIYLKSNSFDHLAPETIVTDFYRLIMRHKAQDGERISYAKELGTKICKLNYYHHEPMLEKMERERGNYRAEVIFSIRKKDKYQFISIDIQHGMFELCDDMGNHKGEFRFDGSPNGDNTAEQDHGLFCVEEWKRMRNRD